MEQTQKKKRKPVMLLILFGLVVISIAAVNGQYSKAAGNMAKNTTAAPTQTKTAKVKPQATSIATPTATSKATAAPTATATPTATVTPTATPTATKPAMTQTDYDKAQAKERLNKAINAKVEEESVYTASTFNAYENALDVAKAINTNTATTEEINAAAKTLEDATAALVTQADYDKAQAIERLNKAINAKVEDENVYTASTWTVYENALNVAKALDTDTATTDEINAAAKTLEDATNALVTQADYDKAQGIERLNAAINAKVEEESVYTSITWTAYENALNAAKAINTGTATTTEMNAAAKTLEDATNALVTQADYDKAQAIERLNAAINAAVEEENVYTASTWTAYETALNAAKALNTITATTEEINAAAKALEDDTKGLKKIVYVTDITVKGKNNATAITKKDGTLQMSATVAPANADNKDIIWSVQNGTGSATITADGLLKAVSNGTVIVKATNVASGVVGTLTVTIENQDYIGYFEDSDVTFILGNWAVDKGAVLPTNGGEHRAVLNGSNGSDYTINVKAKFVSGTNTGQRGYGIYYRASYKDNGAVTGYCFQFDPGAGNRFSIRKVDNGKENAAFASVAMKDIFGSSFDIYASHDIKIIVNGNSHVIYVDGTKVLEFTDDEFKSGYVGFRTWSNSVSQFISASVK